MSFSRAELELIASAVNVNPTAYVNDSKLEQKILYELKVMTAKAGTGTTLVAPPASVVRVSGDKNV